MDKIDPDNHVLRHVTPKNLVTNVITGDAEIAGGAFVDKPRHEGQVSYAWKEYFPPPQENQVQSIRDEFRRDRKKSHKFAELPVGISISGLNAKFPQLNIDVFHDPLEATSDFLKPFGSHALMVNVPYENTALGDAVGDFLTNYVTNVYEALGNE